jgi:hypothetical protein
MVATPRRKVSSLSSVPLMYLIYVLGKYVRLENMY